MTRALRMIWGLLIYTEECHVRVHFPKKSATHVCFFLAFNNGGSLTEKFFLCSQEVRSVTLLLNMRLLLL